MRAGRATSARAVLAVLTASVLSVSASWCDDTCVERAHPLFHRFGFGAPELGYGFTLTTRPSSRVHRFQLSWAAPLGEALEVLGGVALATDGRFEVVPGARYAPVRFGELLVVAVALSAPLSWRAETLDLRVRPAVELHVGFASLGLALELDAAGRADPRLWCAVTLSL